jgi:tetratricopeptide (TPR) repeat protein
MCGIESVVMSRRAKMTRTTKILSSAATALLVSALGASADYIELMNGNRIEGKDARRKLDGTVTIITANGRQEFAKGQYKIAVCEPAPAEMAQGIQAYRSKNFQQAIDTLEKVADDKQGLEVDKTCRSVIARAYAGLNKGMEAPGQFDKLVKVYGADVLKEPSVAVEYAGALLAAKQFDKMGGVLDGIIKDGPRPAAAKAQNLRGQLRETQGNLDAAVLDYMRTAVFFGADGGDAVPEGIYRAAKILDAKKDQRAKGLYKRIAEDYKDSPFASEAKAKI